MSTVYVGAVAPETYLLAVTPGSSGVDLSTVSAASLKVRKADGTLTTWTTSLVNQTASAVDLTHTFVSGDTDVVGTYVIYALLTIPGGTVRTAPLKLTVKGNYEA